ncbi:MAG: nucleoside hydrolase [Nocardioidaceae bacterium]
MPITTPTPIILDCDPGHDDAIAILLALGSPAISLLAVTTTFGNCAIEDATRNALQVLTLAGAADIPVGTGAAGPMSGKVALGNYVHGASGLDGQALPEPAFDVDARGAVHLLRDVLAGADQPVTLVATGPITNVATLLRDHPEAHQNIREIVFMGGSTERGNHTPYAEFNTFADPMALQVVLDSGVPTTMVGLNLTHQACATTQVVERMRAMPHPVGQVAAAWMGFFASSYEKLWDFAAPPVHDPCTIFSLIRPAAVSCVDTFVAVETEGAWTRGATAVDLHDRWGRESNVRVALELDPEQYWDVVLAAIDTVGRRAAAIKREQR